MSDAPVVRARVGEGRLLAACHGAAFAHPWSADDFDRFLEDGAWGYRACRGGAGDAGMLLVRPTDDEAEILTIGVVPALRRTGVAKRLLETVCAEMREAGVRRLFLEVAETNRPARALYRGLGFTSVGRRPNYYAERDPEGRIVGRCAAVLMERALL